MTQNLNKNISHNPELNVGCSVLGLLYNLVLLRWIGLAWKPIQYFVDYPIIYIGMGKDLIKHSALVFTVFTVFTSNLNWQVLEEYSWPWLTLSLFSVLIDD